MLCRARRNDIDVLSDFLYNKISGIFGVVILNYYVFSVIFNVRIVIYKFDPQHDLMKEQTLSLATYKISVLKPSEDQMFSRFQLSQIYINVYM